MGTRPLERCCQVSRNSLFVAAKSIPGNTTNQRPSWNFDHWASKKLVNVTVSQIGNGFHGLTMTYGFWYFI